MPSSAPPASPPGTASPPPATCGAPSPPVCPSRTWSTHPPSQKSPTPLFSLTHASRISAKCDNNNDNNKLRCPLPIPNNNSIRRSRVGGVSFARIRAGHLNPTGRGPFRLGWGQHLLTHAWSPRRGNGPTIQSTITDEGSSAHAYGANDLTPPKPSALGSRRGRVEPPPDPWCARSTHAIACRARGEYEERPAKWGGNCPSLELPCRRGCRAHKFDRLGGNSKLS